MASTEPAESSAAIRERVIAARRIQEERFRNEKGVYCNAQMNSRLLRRYAWPDAEGLARLKEQMERLNMSARAFDRILRVARTISDISRAGPGPARHAKQGSSCVGGGAAAGGEEGRGAGGGGYRSLDRASYGTAF